MRWTATSIPVRSTTMASTRMSPITRLAWWWLRWRGWAVQMNDPERGIGFDDTYGWRPLFSVRYGKTPVYRVGPHRWKPKG